MKREHPCVLKRGEEISLLDVLAIPLKRKRAVLGLPILAAVVAFVVSLLAPNMYTATARLLPPQEPGTGIQGLVSNGGGTMYSLVGGKSSADVYVGILESRTVADDIIQRFGLKEVYGDSTMADVYRKLADRTRVNVSTKTQIISISVKEHDPVIAAAIANGYVDGLDRINRSMNITEGQRKRIFLEGRLTKVERDLAEAESELKDFQQKYRLVALEEQARTVVEGAARIRAEMISAETELEVLKQFRTDRQNETIMLKTRVAELGRQLAIAETGSNGNKAGNGDPQGDPFQFSFQNIPELSMQFGRLVREAKVQEKLFELLTSQYELAKIEEAKDMNTIQILDRAVPPDRKSGPKRVMITALTAVSVFILAVLWAFFTEYLSFMKAHEPQAYSQFLQYAKPWRG